MNRHEPQSSKNANSALPASAGVVCARVLDPYIATIATYGPPASFKHLQRGWRLRSDLRNVGDLEPQYVVIVTLCRCRLCPRPGPVDRNYRDLWATRENSFP